MVVEEKRGGISRLRTAQVSAWLICAWLVCAWLAASTPTAGRGMPVGVDTAQDARLAEAIKAFVEGRYEVARTALEPLAEAGRGEAQYLLGVIYEEGRSVERDLVRAQGWYLRSRQLYNWKAREAAARVSQRLTQDEARQANALAMDDRIVLDKDHGCISFFGEPFLSHYVSLSQAQAPVNEMVEDILGYTGLAKNFQVQSASVPNAAAVIQGGVRYLLYNPQFIEAINRGSGTEWAAYSVMAHEIGHHLQGHTIQPGGSRPPIELEADSFSGFVLAQMGAELDDAQAAMRKIAGQHATATHPAQADRLAAIAEGWTEARRKTGSSSAGSKSRAAGTTPSPRSGRSRVSLPRDWPPHRPALSCRTNWGRCPMSVGVARGSICYCFSRRGWLAGYVVAADPW